MAVELLNIPLVSGTNIGRVAKYWQTAAPAWVLAVGIVFAVAGNTFCQTPPSPPNDHFTNRIVLTGNSITFTGTLAGATTETIPNGPEEVPGYPFVQILNRHSVWWSWTPTESLPVTFQVLEFPPTAGYAGNSGYMGSALAVYTNKCGLLPLQSGTASECPNVTSAGYADAGMTLDSFRVWQGFSFLARAGTEYSIVLHGSILSNYVISLTATNVPLIVEPPKSLTVSPNASALFTVFALGIRPFHYQWRFNGVDLPAETSPMLLLTNVQPEHAGLYSVEVSTPTIPNASTNTSVAASLNVRGEEVIPELLSTRVLSNVLVFTLAGEAGRNYRVEFSTNLANWSPARNFPMSYPFTGSVAFNSNGGMTLSLPRDTPRKYVRASRYTPANEVCNATLKQLRFSKEIWAVEKNKGGTDIAGFVQLAPYFKSNTNRPGQPWLDCPNGGARTANIIGGLPSCSIPGHVLEEPR